MGCADKESFFGKREAFESLRIIENFREKSCWRRQARFRDREMSFPERNDFVNSRRSSVRKIAFDYSIRFSVNGVELRDRFSS